MSDSFVKVEFKAGCFVTLDINEVHLLDGAKWRIVGKGYIGCNSSVDGKRVVIYMHRLIMEKYQTILPGQIIDHINGDRSDNRRENLRVCSSSNNAMNRRMQSKNLSGFKGVYLIRHRDREYYRAKIKVSGKEHSLGLFPTAEAAAFAYDEAARKFQGEFARTNFPALP